MSAQSSTTSAYLDVITEQTEAIHRAQSTIAAAVEAAREAGATWSAIAAAHGLTRQGAQQRYGRNEER